MHRHGLAMSSVLGCLLAFLLGCAADTPKALLVRAIYVEEATDAPTPELARRADVIHDTSVRTLRQVGFTAVAEPAEADAVLRAAWVVRPSVAGRPEGRVTLRLSLVGRDGALLKVDDGIADVPAAFLTDERIADLVRARLATFAR